MFPNSEYIFVKNISDGIDEYKQVTDDMDTDVAWAENYQASKKIITEMAAKGELGD